VDSGFRGVEAGFLSLRTRNKREWTGLTGFFRICRIREFC
jgi:hypothetical protein